MEHALTVASVHCVEAWVSLLELGIEGDRTVCGGNTSVAEALRHLEDDIKRRGAIQQHLEVDDMLPTVSILRRLEANPEAKKWTRLGSVACRRLAPEPDAAFGTVAQAPRLFWRAIIGTMEVDAEIARKWAQDLITDADLVRLVELRRGNEDFSALLRINGVAATLMMANPSDGASARAPSGSSMCSLRSAQGEWKRPSAYAQSSYYGGSRGVSLPLCPPVPLLQLFLGLTLVILACVCVFLAHNKLGL